MIKTVVLGNGNLATHLCQAFEKNEEIQLLQNYNRSGKKITNSTVYVTSTIEEIVNAEVYILAISDTALYDLSLFKKLNGLVVHTSGATPMDVLTNFTNHGVFYPTQSFIANATTSFSQTPIAIEANSVLSEKILLHLANAISNKVYHLDSKQRSALHLAAVFANNFSTFMYTQAMEICKQHHIDFEILNPLIVETITKISNQPPNEIQTGPAIRNDQQTIDRHLSLLQEEQQKRIYQHLTLAIQDYYGKEL